MKKIATAILLFFLPLIMQAQFKVTLVNSNITSDDDSIYITGSFNGWEYNTNDKYELKSTGLNEKSVSLILDAGKHTYKFHRGSLGHIEMKFYNDQTIGEMPDRVIEISKDTVIHFTIDAWIDTMPYTPIYFLSKSLIKNVQSTQNLNIWKFKKGNNNNWSRVDLNTSDWENLKPTDINITFADQDGRIEGWFRTRIIFDSTFKDEPINMWVDSWAATETYIDGELVQSSGNLGANGEPFKEGRFKHVLPEDLILATGVDHILSVHFVDQLSGLPNREFKGPLKIEFADDLTMINLKEHITNEPIFTTIALTTGIIMTFLFWFLSVLITGEPNLARIATFSTLLTLLVISYWMDHNPSASYDAIVITHFLTNILIPTILIFSIYLLVKIFNRRVSRILKIIFIIIAFLGLLTLLNFSSPAPMIGLLLVIVTCVYYIITSFKSLRGAQWAVVAGISSLFAIVIFATIYFNFFNTRVNFLTISIFATALNLSFPLSLLIYTALRFKEMIKEVEFNASRVIKLSEEKKEQAIHQQKLLKEEVARQTVELRNSLDNLKSTQSQLIQSEKMASLGELTAGIAHEIQNPLNFVNNFAEVNIELIDELETERSKDKEKREDDIEKDMLKDLKENEEKIKYHGKRAEAIVKGMLQHSRTSSGRKELTDINELADEYIRLAYHGLRAKDKSFNADFKADLDPSLSKIEVVPQDISRVLLNLINNAFYTVSEKAKVNKVEYSPEVSVSTKMDTNYIEIKVKDNGNGIPQELKEKIFQPFFTTKPTGKGTGLGLSLSYDIIKAHGGEIKVESIEGEGTEFAILLGINAD